MKIRHSALEQIRGNPKLLKNYSTSSATTIMKIGRFRLLQLSIFYYHKKNDERGAFKYLNDKYVSLKFKFPEKLLSLENQLDSYIKTFKNLNSTFIKACDRINIEVSPKVIIAGEIPRIDVLGAGYLICFFTQNKYDWKGELRMPLIHKYYTEVWGIDHKEIKIGMYNFDKSEYEFIIFNKTQHKIALQEAKKLLVV